MLTDHYPGVPLDQLAFRLTHVRKAHPAKPGGPTIYSLKIVVPLYAVKTGLT